MSRSPTPQEAGRNDPPRTLADRLPHAESGYLEGALENPCLDEDLVVVLLRNRAATQPILTRIYRDPRFRRSHAVRLGLTGHPRTPRGIAMNLAHHLYWRDLARVADDVRVPPPVRRLAVRILQDRLDEMALGEQITLARTAGRSVVLALRATREEPVARALLDNPRLVEDDLKVIARDADTPREILALLGRTPRWIRRYGVRLALVHNARTPAGVMLGLLTGLLRRDLEDVAGRPDLPRVVRLAAARVLESRGHGPGAEGSGTADDVFFLADE